MKRTIVGFMLLVVVASADAKTLSIGLDVSRSNPLLSDPGFATDAARHAASEVMKLKHGDVVRVSTLGSRHEGRNLSSQRFKISNKLRPSKAAKLTAQLILSLSRQENVAQSSTNLIAWMEFNSNFDCNEESSVFVITDALEASSYIEAEELLEGEKSLPEPDVNLEGCSVTFYGLGVGWPPKEVKTLRREWRQWMDKAKVSEFKAIIPG